jgi:hypothetical protein
MSEETKIKVLVRIAPPQVSAILAEMHSAETGLQRKRSFTPDEFQQPPSNVAALRRDMHTVRTINPKENIRSKEKEYTYDHVFDSGASQEEVNYFYISVYHNIEGWKLMELPIVMKIYEALNAELLESLSGHNVNIFAHGATGGNVLLTKIAYS